MIFIKKILKNSNNKIGLDRSKEISACLVGLIKLTFLSLNLEYLFIIF